jgi:hypothetical protein
MAREKQKFGLDMRGETKVDPKVELKDYSGPFKSDLRFSDFSREQGSRMYSLAHHYNYMNVRNYSGYIYDRWGREKYLEAQEYVWGKMLPKDIHGWITEAMNIKGQDLEAFMKAWQIDLNSQPGDYFDVIIEMPSKDRGLVTFNRCPLVEEYESSGKTGEILDVCKKACLPAIQNTAKFYHPDIEVNALALPPRKGKDHICCKFEICYKGKCSGKKEKVDLKIDKKKKDIRMDPKVNPKMELKDYSGPFKPDLRITDFSREQLAKMYLMAHKYDLGLMMHYNEWVGHKLGFDGVADMNVHIWGHKVLSPLKKLTEILLNTPGNDIASFMKAWQIDVTSLPPYFDMYFEMPSPDRGIITFNKCRGLLWMEELKVPTEMALRLCSMEPPCIGNSAKFYHPDMKVKIHAFPPREGKDEVCCKWELYYDKKGDAPRVTRYDGKVWRDEDLVEEK